MAETLLVLDESESAYRILVMFDGRKWRASGIHVKGRQKLGLADMAFQSSAGGIPMNRAFIFAAIVMASWTNAAKAATFGKCGFDTVSRAFAGTAKEQASCLLRKVKILGNVDPQSAVLPPNLLGSIGQPLNVSKVKIRQFIEALNLTENDLGGSLDAGLSRGNNNSSSAPMARYFVIHDTSTPNFGNQAFPADVDTNNRVNGFNPYKSANNAKAHIFLNRPGAIYVGHDFGVPWRATKLELKIGTLTKGLFLHIENVQPRRAHPSQPDGNAPTPGFTTVQYDRLALFYVMTSVRAGQGLIPAFHAAVDQGLLDGHDDPQNFSLSDFDGALGRVLEKVR
ncbi:hypothetical protein [Rhizobium laguerreae]|uniref:hypothetical protein n=1 Tax=Rhizobium laguerreae TaxID=1076926 RepID=UPI001C8FEC0F|nr:hypothetical protein [Rhizobium laguerreae]MBY3198222.1 hypothetical protein [Rhizobium laguerreae]